MENRVEAVIFDWAGTTVDFGCFAPVNVFMDVFKEVGIEVTIDEARGPMGMLKRDHIKAMLEMKRIEELWREKFGKTPDESDVDNLYEKFEPALMSSLEQYTDPIDHAIDAANWLREKGIKIGSTTGYTGEMMEIVAAKAREKGYYPDCLVTSDDTDSIGRPYPFMIFRNMQKLKVKSPAQVIKIGDTVTDIREGSNAGCWSVGVAIGSSEMGLSETEFNSLSEDQKEERISMVKKVFQDSGADLVIDDLSEVPELVERVQSLLDLGKLPNCILNQA